MINERTLNLHIAWSVIGFAVCMVAYFALLYFDHDTAAVLCGGLGMGWTARGVPFAVIEYVDARKQHPRHVGDDR